ncbi:proteasome subunit alpha [Enteractinococcus coprophilus]|uniref:Proteasome alpha subunit n=1 Tax=Enteractinococcus coprophilus TaxID=1027633 RepID=A0A543AJD4_9MICC|nr:proteasome subunit alpha [Enteractinococcus coprophilus]TQL72680.1 proteasome alpha subunit [Enteractinococcus coprophilus]
MQPPMYVSPQQQMEDRADFARAGIRRGQPVVFASTTQGIVSLTHNASQSLFKLSEIYDRISWGAVGRYNEFEALRQAGIRYTDTRGYAYERSDVTARGLANMYARTLGELFISGTKPFEVEIAVAEVAAAPEDDRLYQITFDGTLLEHHGLLVLGGNAQDLHHQLQEALPPTARELDATVSIIREQLGTTGSHVELAILDRDPQALRGSHRAFRRLDPQTF